MPLTKLPGFDEAVERHQWQGSRAVMLHQGDRHCRSCSFGILVRMTGGVQMALFYHGGYGAAERRTIDVCLACGHTNIVQFETLNPRHAG